MEITKYKCIKDFEMVDGVIAFHEGEIYEAKGQNFISEIEETGFNHTLSEEKILEYFERVNPEKELLKQIFNYASGGYLQTGEFSDQKIKKGHKYAMEEIIEKFFKEESEQAKARLTATQIADQFEINEAVLEQLKQLAK